MRIRYHTNPFDRVLRAHGDHLITSSMDRADHGMAVFDTFSWPLNSPFPCPFSTGGGGQPSSKGIPGRRAAPVMVMVIIAKPALKEKLEFNTDEKRISRRSVEGL